MQIIQLQVKSTASVCCLVGIPGSGKSTIARAIIERNRRCGSNKLSSCEDSDHDVPTEDDAILHFDDILLIDYDDLTTKELKHDNNRNHCSSFDSNDLEAWRKSRLVAVGKLKEALTTHFAYDGDTASTLLIILDDNFHLRSMRRDIYRSCQEIIELHPHAQIGFAVVYCTTPLDVCLRRNDLRSGKERIPQDVINRMAMFIEPPDETKPCSSFERFHISIDNADDLAERNDGDRHFLSEIHECLEESLQSPVLPKNELSREEIIELEQKRVRDREETLNSKFHRIDQLLRKLVGAVGRIQKEKSKEANDVRKSILWTLRRHNDVDNMGDDCIAQRFACSILGAEVDRRNDALDNPLAMAINDAARKFGKENMDVT